MEIIGAFKLWNDEKIRWSDVIKQVEIYIELETSEYL